MRKDVKDAAAVRLELELELELLGRLAVHPSNCCADIARCAKFVRRLW